MRASALVVTALAVVAACTGRGEPPPVDVATGPVFERALRLVADSAGLPDLHVDPRSLAAGAGFDQEALVDLDDAVLAARERGAARAGFPRADAFLAVACFRPYEELVIGADTLRPPPHPEDIRRQCESGPGADGRHVMIQEAPRPAAGYGGWRVRAYVVGAGTFQVWDAYVDGDLSGGHATLIEDWWGVDRGVGWVALAAAFGAGCLGPRGHADPTRPGPLYRVVLERETCLCRTTRASGSSASTSPIRTPTRSPSPSDRYEAGRGLAGH